MPHKVERIYAFVGVQSGDEDEGIEAAWIPGTKIAGPLVTTLEKNLGRMSELAQIISDQQGRSISLFEFTGKRLVNILFPQNK